MLGGRKEEGRGVSEGQFHRLFLSHSALILPGMSLLFGPSGLSVSAVRVIWCRDCINQAASAGKEQGARSL